MSVLPEMRLLNHQRIMPGMIISNQPTSPYPVAVFKKSHSFSSGDAKLDRETSYKYIKNLFRYPSSSVKNSKHLQAVNCSSKPISVGNLHARIDHGLLLSTESTTKERIRTLILDNYDSYTYNLYQLLSVINGVAPVVLRNDEVTWEELCYLLYEKRAFDNVVISPGPGSPTCASDIGVCLRLLKECSDIPILGVCLGHQALGAVHGAEIVHAPEPVHGRLSEIQHSAHPLFVNIPSGANSGFKVVRYHSLMVDASTLPDDLIATAWTTSSKDCISVSDGLNGSIFATLTDSQGALDGEGSFLNSALFEDNSDNVRSDFDSSSVSSSGNRGTRVLMGISHRYWPHHGVQFHPESVATAYGKQILENFRNMTLEFWKKQSGEPNPTNKMLRTFTSQDLVNVGLAALLKRRYHEALLKGPSLCSDEPLPPYYTKVASNDVSHSVLHRSEEQNKEGGLLKPGQAEILRLHWKKLPGLATRVGGSKNLFCKIYGTEAVQDTFWLDSSTRDQVIFSSNSRSSV